MKKDNNKLPRIKLRGIRRIKKEYDEHYDSDEKEPKFLFQDKHNQRFFYAQKDALNYLGNINGKKILILGCGYGHEAKQFCQNNALIFITDISINAIKKKISENKDVYHDFEIAVVDAEQIPYGSNLFDIVYVQALMMLVNTEDVASEVSRVLKDGGHFILIEPMDKNPVAVIYRKLILSSRSFSPQYMSYDDFVNISKYFNKSIIFEGYFLFVPFYYFLNLLFTDEKKKKRIVLKYSYYL